jgi:hypothetical protein
MQNIVLHKVLNPNCGTYNTNIQSIMKYITDLQKAFIRVFFIIFFIYKIRFIILVQ